MGDADKMIRHKFKPRSKYGAKPNIVDGIRFDSRKESRRYSELKLLVSAGDVIMFLRQVPFHLPGNTTYRCDFQIFWASGEVTHEDTKGFETEVFKIKKRQVEDLYPIVIEVT